MFRFALGWLDHHCPGDRPGNCRRVKAIIHQAFCHVFDFDPGAFPLAKIDDAFVRNEAVFAFEKNWKVWIEPFGDVICVENCDIARLFQSLGAHHADVYSRDCQNAGAAPGCRGNVTSFASAVSVIRTDSSTGRTLSALSFAKQDSTCLWIEDELSRKIRHEMVGHADRPHAWATASVGDAKGLVQI